MNTLAFVLGAVSFVVIIAFCLALIRGSKGPEEEAFIV